MGQDTTRIDADDSINTFVDGATNRSDYPHQPARYALKNTGYALATIIYITAKIGFRCLPEILGGIKGVSDASNSPVDMSNYYLPALFVNQLARLNSTAEENRTLKKTLISTSLTPVRFAIAYGVMYGIIKVSS